MTNQELFKEAIADAKAIRETALANAKSALEEALAPRLQSMLSAKLQEMEDGDEEKNVEEGFYPSETQDPIQDRYRATGAALEENDYELEEDFDLSELLAELEAEDSLEEAKKKDEDKKEKKDSKEKKEDGDDKKEKDEEPEMNLEPMEMEPESAETVADLSVEELKMIIKDIVSSEMTGGDMSGIDDMGGEDMGAEDDMSIDMSMGDTDDDVSEDFNLEELLAELDALGEEDSYNELEEAKKKTKDEEKEKKMKKELDEAIATIRTLRTELNEVNLLNAKLLYVNRIFKSKNLTESQKLKVIAQFDRAATVKEAKMIYETMDVAIAKTNTKSPIKESMGFASKAVGVASKPIVEVDETMSRWQMLAGIKKY